MASTINASNSGGGGIIQTADASGVLNLQGGGNTGISISAAGVPTITAPTISGIMTGVGSNSVLTNLSAPVTLTLANTWYNGPNTGSIGASGQKWLIVACGSVYLSTGAIYGEIAIHDGTNFLAAQGSVGGNTNWQALGTASYVVTLSGATTFTLKAAANSANAVLAAGNTYNTTLSPTYIYAVRLA